MSLWIQYPLRLKLLYEAKAKGLQAALLWEPKGSFVADRCFFRIGVATNAIIPRWPPNLGGQSRGLGKLLYYLHCYYYCKDRGLFINMQKCNGLSRMWGYSDL